MLSFDRDHAAGRRIPGLVRVLGALAAAALTVAACGDDGNDTTASQPPSTLTDDRAAGETVGNQPSDDATADETAPEDETVPDDGPGPFEPFTIIDDLGSAVRVESIDRIIPLDGDIAEVVFALGYGDNVVATDLSATYPPEADALPEIGYQRALSAESIAAFDPTLLLATEVAGPPEALDDLRRLGYPLVIVPSEATAEGPGDKIRAVAAALGDGEAGERLASEVDASIASAARDEESAVRVAALYLRGDTTQLVLGAASATHWIIEAAGGVDVSVELGISEAEPINAEAILAANPDVLLVTTTGLASVGGIDGLAGIGSLGETEAGLNGQVVAFDDQLLLGNGPRVAEVLAGLSAQIEAIATAST
ncbi:MAG: ABC transporter substrate-binding protein [Actinomycetota bacterium]